MCIEPGACPLLVDGHRAFTCDFRPYADFVTLKSYNHPTGERGISFFQIPATHHTYQWGVFAATSAGFRVNGQKVCMGGCVAFSGLCLPIRGGLRVLLD